MEESKPNIVEVFPDPLILIQSKNSNYIESQLNFRNLTNEYIIFKIFNNQQSLYSVKPHISFIPPKETTTVSIKRFKKEEIISEYTKGKDKFLLLFYVINKVINNREEVKEAFKSKLYEEESKQEIMIPIIIKEDDEAGLTFPVVQDNLEGDYNNNIKKYNDINENLRKEINKINNNIKNLEKVLEMVKIQKKLQKDKDKALAIKTNKIKSKGENYVNILMILILLLGLLLGGNLAKGYNNMFKVKPIKKQIVINKSENYVYKKINENNEINKEVKMNENIKDDNAKESQKWEKKEIVDQKSNNDKNNKNENKGKQSNDFLSFSFLIGVYLCLLQTII